MDSLNNIQQILGSQFQFMIAGVLLSSITYLFKSVGNIHISYEFFSSLFGIKYNKIIISGKLVKIKAKSELEEADFSIKFKSILYQIKKSGYANSGVNQLVEGPTTNSASDTFIVAQPTTFILCPDIYCKIVQEPKEHDYSGKDSVPSFRAEILSQTNDVEHLEQLIAGWIKEYTQFAHETGENLIQLHGSLMASYDKSFNFSNKFLAVLHKMNSLDFDLPHIKILTELQIQEPVDRYSRDDEQKEELRKAENLVPEVCEIENDVFCKVEWTKTDKGITEYSIKITSEVLNVKELTNLLHTWEKEYDIHNQVGDGLKYFVFSSSNGANSHQLFQNANLGPKCTEFSFESVKSFSNVFFPEKESLMKRIEFFENNESWFTEKGVPYMLGLLFHGEPGCGKTSTIKAIANMTQRHIISVPLKNVRAVSDLYDIFYGAKVNNRSIAMDKRLYVLEDIDCGGLEDIVKKRKTKDDDKDNEDSKKFKKWAKDNWGEKQDDDDKEKEMDKKKEDNKKELTLSDLLEVFDGVMESKGRMMVITTNHLDKLDPALTRPGRVDTCLHFRKCLPAAILDIFYNFYGPDSLPPDFDIKQVPDNVWTPAEIVQTFVNHCAEPSLGLQVVCLQP